jgi:nucleotide-binding universal stress UspA family protein
MSAAITRILAATDFSPDAAAAARLAAELAARFQASLTLLHVYQLPVWVSPDGGVLQPTAAMLARQAQLVDEQLAAARQALAEGHAPIAVISAIGEPAQEIARIAEGYDLVVMGTRGRTALSHLLAGSVAEKVLRRCARPVLTVHAPHAPHPPR